MAAVGEIGLDYHYEIYPRELQKKVLENQILLSKELLKPVILHSRESTADMMDILRRTDCRSGVMHCFSGSVETAREVLDRGLYIGVGGSLTFKNNVKTAEVVKYAPLDRLMLETDSPYMAPVPYRGKRNDPRYTELVAARIAEIKGTDIDTVAEASAGNIRKLFGI